MELKERIKNDTLLPLILHANKQINGYSFFTLFLFRMLILSTIFSLTNSTIIILPLTFYFIYNLLKARCKDVMQSIPVKLTVLIIICTLIITEFFYMSFTVFIFYIYHVPPQLFFGGDLAAFASVFSLSVWLINLIHFISGVFTIIIIIIFSVLKGNKEVSTSPDSGSSAKKAGLSPDYPWTAVNNMFQSMFLCKGRMSRTGFLYNLLILGFFSYLVIVIFFIVLFAFEDFSLPQLASNLDSRFNLILITIVSLCLFILNAWIYLVVITKRLSEIGWVRFLSIPIFILIIISAVFHPVFIRFFFTTVIFRFFSQANAVIINQYFGPFINVVAECFRTLTVIVMSLLYFIPGKKDSTPGL